MKIGILTHFGSFQPGYAIHVGWLERAKLLEYFDQDFDFLVDDNCPEGLYPNQKNYLKRIKSSIDFDQRVEFFTTNYKEVLAPYDAILTADIIYQRKGNYLPRNQAMRNAAEHLKAKWYHWIHSSWTFRPKTIRYPENLRYDFMPNSKVIYLNSYELKNVAEMFSTSQENVWCVYNPKDYRSFNDFHPAAWQICKLLDIPNKDAIQIFPHSAERAESKGLWAVVRTFSALKRHGMDVALILAVANYRSQLHIIEKYKKIMEERYDLFEGYDFIYTSDLMEDHKALPRRAVADLFKVANVFVFGSWRETVGNIFQEAKISGNLMVLNRHLPSCVEMGGRDAVYFQSTFKTPGIRDTVTGDTQMVSYGDGSEEDEDKYFNNVAQGIIPIIPSRKHLWQFSFEWIWEHQFKPLLYGREEK